MRIADVNEFYATRGGGVRRYVEGKLAAAAHHGHDLTVIAPGPQDQVEEREGGRIVWVQGPPLPLDPRYYVLWNQQAVARALETHDPDIIEGSSVWTSGWFARQGGCSTRRGTPRKRVLFFHQDAVAVYGHTLFDKLLPTRWIDRSNTPFWRYLAKLSSSFDSTIVGGAWLQRRLARFGVHEPVSIPLGIDKGLFTPELRSQALRESLCKRCGIPTGGTLLVAVSRHHPEKRIGTLIQAVKKASRQQDVGLLLFGDGPLRRWVEQKSIGLPQVVIEGFVEDRRELAKVVASSDGFLHGSAAETFGLVVAEAIAAGTPVIVPNVGGAMDLAGPGHAETYRPGNSEDCAKAILRLAGRNQKALRQACLRYRDESIGTMGQHFEQLFEHYERLLASGPASALGLDEATESNRSEVSSNAPP